MALKLVSIFSFDGKTSKGFHAFHIHIFLYLVNNTCKTLLCFPTYGV